MSPKVPCITSSGELNRQFSETGHGMCAVGQDILNLVTLVLFVLDVNPPLSWCALLQDVYQDRRLAVMLALMARCALDPEAFAMYNLSEVIDKQLSGEDMRGRYYAGEEQRSLLLFACKMFSSVRDTWVAGCLWKKDETGIGG